MKVIRPLRNNVLVQEIPVLKTPDGMYLLNQTAPEFRVLAVGPTTDPAIVPGSRALPMYTASTRNYVGPRQFLMPDSDIALVIP
jgi:hypothetical protein